MVTYFKYFLQWEMFFSSDSKKRLKDVLKQFRDGEFSQYKPEEVNFITFPQASRSCTFIPAEDDYSDKGILFM